MFYKLHQNNSGGNHDVTDTLCANLIIEANSEEVALAKAEELGCYWDGVSKGIDCECCGDRWSRYTDGINLSDLNRSARVYGKTEDKAKSEWIAKYGSYQRDEEPQTEYLPWSRGYKCEGIVKLRTIEEYAQYEADDNGGWTSPEVRVFYADGTVKEFYQRKNLI